MTDEDIEPEPVKLPPREPGRTSLRTGSTLTGTATIPNYVNPLPSTMTVGGIPIGTDFPLPGMTTQQMWDMLLYPFIPPTFTSFLMTGVTVLEVGDSIDNAAQPLTWTTTLPGNIAPNLIRIDDITNVVVLETLLPNTGTVNHDFSGAGAITYVTDDINVFRITGTDTDVPPGTFTYNLTIHWHWMVYAGTSANAGPINEAAIEALADYAALSSGFARTYALAAGNYKYVSYPSALGLATTFKDLLTGLDVPMEAPYNVNVTNTQGILTAYRVHRTTNILGAAIDLVVS
jgi:hypothetical protein